MYLKMGYVIVNDLIPAQLILKTNEIFHGYAPSDQTDSYSGEVVFNTGMVGYVESLTDPSYAGEILVFTYPLIGNYGVSSPETWESKKIQVSGVIFSELTTFKDHYSAQSSLFQWLRDQKIPFLTGVDTRALTKRLRTKGVIPGIICPQGQTSKEFVDFEHTNWVEKVSIDAPVYYGSGEKTVIVVDCGLKENSLRSLLQFPLRIKRVPHDYDYTEENYDGLFISNGPGDPERCTATIAHLRKALLRKKPTFGICLGTQLMALAIGAKTYKLPFGHRSQNQPCLEIKSNRCFLTSQNHGYAVEEQSLPADWLVSFRNLNDQTVAGIEHKSFPFFSVQFHPEASPGPLDTQWLFKKFYEMF